MIPRGLGLALAVAAAAQAALLGSAVWDRAGDGGGALRLTDREAPLASASSLALAWTEAASPGDPWLDARLLARLGFDCSEPPAAPAARARYERALPRRAWVVLEHEGDAWQEELSLATMEGRARGERVARGELSRAEFDEASALLGRRRRSDSRLLVVDAASGPAELRRRWPDRPGRALARALVRPQVRATPSGPVLGGQVVALLPARLSLASGEARRLAALVPPGDRGAGYAVEVRYGRLGRPRVVRVLPP